MVEFGEFTDTEKEKFSEEIHKDMNKSVNDEEMQLWPEDDEVIIKNYFKKQGKEV